MRTESDVHGPHGSHAPACLHCGFPLHPEVEVCPFCDEAVAPVETSRALALRTPDEPAIPLRERVLLIGTCLVIAATGIGVAVTLFG